MTVINFNSGSDPTTHDARMSSSGTKRIASGLVSAGTVPWSWELKQMDASGFTITQRDGVGANRTASYIALKSTDWTFLVGEYDIPTSGNVTESGLGFTPEFLFEVLTQIDTQDATQTGGDAGVLSIVINDGTTEASHCIASEDNVETTNVSSFTSSDDTTMMDHTNVATGAEAFVATTVLSAGQFVKTGTDHPATAKKAFYLAGGPASGVTITSVSGDDAWTDGDTGIPIVGTGFV